MSEITVGRNRAGLRRVDPSRTARHRGGRCIPLGYRQGRLHSKLDKKPSDEWPPWESRAEEWAPPSKWESDSQDAPRKLGGPILGGEYDT